MLALSIRQPFAELILRGVKTVEYRSRATRIIGERFWIYASRGQTNKSKNEQTDWGIWSRDLSTRGRLPDWMLELAEQVNLIPPGTQLQRGVIVGSAVIERCEEVGRDFPQAGSLGPVASRSSGTDESLATGHRSPTTVFRWHLADVERASQFRKPTGRPQPVWFKPF